MTVVARRLPVMGAVNAGKSQRLSVMGSELDRVRAAVWARFAGAKTAHLSKRQIRARLMAEPDRHKFVCRSGYGGPPWKTPSIRSAPGNRR